MIPIAEAEHIWAEVKSPVVLHVATWCHWKHLRFGLILQEVQSGIIRDLLNWFLTFSLLCMTELTENQWNEYTFNSIVSIHVRANFVLITYSLLFMIKSGCVLLPVWVKNFKCEVIINSKWYEHNNSQGKCYFPCLQENDMGSKARMEDFEFINLRCQKQYRLMIISATLTTCSSEWQGIYQLQKFTWCHSHLSSQND